MEELNMDFLIEHGYEERIEELKKINMRLHEKAGDGGGLTEREEGMFDLLYWLYHDEEKPL